MDMENIFSKLFHDLVNSSPAKSIPPTPQTTISDLYKLADNIINLKARHSGNSDYNLMVFQTINGGQPSIIGNLHLPIRVITISNSSQGQGYNVILKARRLEGVLDLEGEQIYEADNGTLFVYKYVPISPLTFFDFGMFLAPKIEFEELKDIHSTFLETTEQLLEPFQIDELAKMALVNRIVDLQKLAYQQGKSSSPLMSSALS
jgi:hypothetical protein